MAWKGAVCGQMRTGVGHVCSALLGWGLLATGCGAHETRTGADDANRPWEQGTRGPTDGGRTAAVVDGGDRAAMPDRDVGDAGPRKESDAGHEMSTATDGAVSRPVESFSVLSINLRCLSLESLRFDSNAARFDAIAAAVATHAVDAVLAQELCVREDTDARVLLREALARATGEAWDAFSVFAHRAWEGTPRAADEYVGIFAPRLADQRPLVHASQRGLRRVAAVASAVGRTGAVRLVSVHFEHANQAVRRHQAQETAVFALSHGPVQLRTVIGGDFNATAGSATHDAVRSAGFLDASDRLASTRIDHVFSHRASGLVDPEAALVFNDPASAVSDHPGVLARWRVSAGASEVRTTELSITASIQSSESSLWFRSDHEPFSWNAGWPLFRVGEGRWRLRWTEFSTPLEWKVLVDDRHWQRGPNLVLSPGTKAEVSVMF